MHGFLDRIHEAELIQYLKERNLYKTTLYVRGGRVMCSLFGLIDYQNALTTRQKKPDFTGACQGMRGTRNGRDRHRI